MKTSPCTMPGARRALRIAATLVFAAALVPMPCATAAEVGGTIAVNTAFAAADSPYLVTSNLEVAAGVTLSIEPGVLVRFAANRSLTIKGHLAVNGTTAAPVIFTDARDDEPGGDLNGDGDATIPVPGGWGGLLFLDGASGELRHAEIRYAGYLGSWFALWHQGGGALTLADCTIRDAGGTGAWLREASGGVNIENCAFVRCGANGLHLSNSPALLVGNSFSNNTVGLLVENVSAPLAANGSSFTGNSTAGASATNSGLLDARDSWWGDASGPQHAGNPGGLGDPVGEGVLFDPWSDGIARATIRVAAEPADGGTVSGGGAFAAGSEVTVTATPTMGTRFVNWTEGGDEVSASAAYTFTLTGDRDLVANFAALPGSRRFSVSYATGPDLNIPRNAPVNRAIIDAAGRALVLCGTTSEYVSLGNSEIYNPATNTFTTRQMNSIRGSTPVVVQLADGRHLIAGGDSNLGVPARNTAEIFDPVAGTFTPTGNMNQVRASASGIRLADGRVLVAGAWYRNYANTAELYNPATGTFTQPASTMSQPRVRPALLPRDDGKVLVLGGYAPYDGAQLQSLDLFDPATDSFSRVSDGIYLPDDGVYFSTREDYHTRLGDGTYLVMGYAVVGAQWNVRAMIYNPQSGTFTPTAEQPPMGFYAGPQWLPEQQIAVCTTLDAGAFGIMIHDPLDGRFHLSGETIALPANHTMGGNSAVAVLPDGRLLVAGGTERTGYDFNFGAIANTLLVTIDVETPITPTGGWVAQTSGIDADLYTVHFLDGQTGWVGGRIWQTEVPVLLRTNDGGETWTPMNGGAEKSVIGIHFFDVNHGWMIGNSYGTPYTGSIQQTTDGGATWTTRLQIIDRTFSDLFFLDDSNGWACGDGIFRTTDGGATWTEQTIPPEHNFSSIHFADANTGWAAGSDWENWRGVIFKTTNGGATWASQTIHDSEYLGQLGGMSFADASNGLVIGGHGEMLRSTNGGADWYPVEGIPFGHPAAVTFTSPQTVWMIGSWWGWDFGPPYDEESSYAIMKSSDGGSNWLLDQSADSINVWLSDVHFPTPANGWAVGTGGAILKYTAAGVPPPPGYSDWALLHFTPDEVAAGLHLPDADPGSLRIPNLTRYALDLGVRVPRREWLPRAHQSAPGSGGFALWISLPDPVPPDAELMLGASANLEDWNEHPMHEWEILGESTVEGRRHLLVRPPAIPGDGSSLFLNLIIHLRSP